VADRTAGHGFRLTSVQHHPAGADVLKIKNGTANARRLHRIREAGMVEIFIEVLIQRRFLIVAKAGAFVRDGEPGDALEETDSGHVRPRSTE